jgi:hypothetical protein
MITLLLHLLRLLPVLCAGYRQLALENLALRQQFAMYKRMARRPKFRRTDRLFWGWLVRVWAGWKQSRPSGPVLAGRALLAWWRGDLTFRQALEAGLVTEGRRDWVRAFPSWFERYLFAAIAPASRATTTRRASPRAAAPATR